MPFCKNFMTGIRKVTNQIDDVLGKTIAEVTRTTKIIKESGLIPADSKVGAFINTAIEEVTGVIDATKSAQEKLNEWLDSAPTEVDKERKVFNIASGAVKAADVANGNEAKSTIVYEAGVIAQIIADKKL